MKPCWLLLISLTVFQSCGPHENSEERFLIRNNTNSELIWQTFYVGKQGANMTYPAGVTDYAGSGGELGVDSVKFIKGNNVLTFINPKYDFAAYELSKDWNYFNSANWVMENENVFVYTLKEEYF
jgi:hypothetical protein